MLTAIADPQIALGLAAAVIAASETPLLLLDGDLGVVGASPSFCRAFGVEGASGESLMSLGGGEWDRPELRRQLLTAAAGKAPVDAVEMDLDQDGGARRLVLTVQKLPNADSEAVWLLVSANDVTDLRDENHRLEDLLREKTMLLQEVQHRTANSLQIVASVLLSSARQVEQEQARDHLASAHGRIMAIASVQKQLAQSSFEDVALKPYLTELCASLAAAMISDPERIGMHLDCDPVMISPRTCTSLGLIVAEMVINAVKHAFPGGRSGEIRVSYTAKDEAWALCVADNGVGRPKSPAEGLGGGILHALATQLHATVEQIDAPPGFTACIDHGAVLRRIKAEAW